MAGRHDVWEWVEQGRREPGEVRRRVTAMSEQDLVDLYWAYDQVVTDLNEDCLTAHLERPLSDDDLDDIAHWVVSQELDHYEDVMTGHALMPNRVPAAVSPPFWSGKITKVYHERYGTPVRFPDEPPPAEGRRTAP